MTSNQLQSFSQSASKAPPKQLTTSNGAPVDSLTASMTAGPNGPIVLQDFTLIDHLASFDRERIPERVVHAKGAGAFGYFEVTKDDVIRKICKADMFKGIGKRTAVGVRFSTVGGESGSPDTARDPRGFAVKFYTEEGNWDIVGNNTPIFFLRDPMLFPSFIHTQKRNPVTHLGDADMFWDFISLRPETVHQVSFLFSDRGTPNGYRHINGYGSHTFKNVNENGEAVYVKYHFKTDQGISNLTPEQASQLASSDGDYAIRDLYNAIAKGNPPSWTMYVQIMTYDQAKQSPFNPFDLTKIWPHNEYPLHEVGRLVLDQNPDNYFAQVEQLAFSPSHLIPGIEPSPDKMLQARLFSYPDTHRHRLGANYQQIPVNAPLHMNTNNYQRDGPMTVNSNGGGAPNYFPNMFHGSRPSVKNGNHRWHSDNATGDVERVETGDEDNFSQCRDFFLKTLSAEERDRLTTNISNHLANASEPIRIRAISNFACVHPEYGKAISEKVKAQLKDRYGKAVVQAEVSALSPMRTVPNDLKSQTCPFGFQSSKL
mmetsp:Transcript_10976/g.12717  ORF Transcript_10976/g.12717 Transcript_10976/m.12717 type:complete len:541 (+) Transcript_10976:44-1666(+)